jgi:hypothetical protein
MLVDGGFGRVDAEERCELANRTPVGDPGCDMRPLPRIRALGEEAAELVERGRRAQDPVRVVVDERDLAEVCQERRVRPRNLPSHVVSRDCRESVPIRASASRRRQYLRK